MVIKRMVLVVLAVVLVCGMAVGCNKNSSLNGTWVYEDDDRQIILKLNNGNFEVLIGDMNYLKGTYSVTDGQMTFKTTAIHGSLFQGGGYVMDYVKQYSLDELETILDLDDDDFEGVKEEVMDGSTFSVSENTLTGNILGNEFTFTRQ